MRNINNRIREVRKANGLTVRQFGEIVGISSTAISKIENGINNPSEQTIRAICSEFHVSREWLEGGVGEMNESADESDAALAARIVNGQSENKKRLLRLLADMPDELLDGMMDYLERKK